MAEANWVNRMTQQEWARWAAICECKEATRQFLRLLRNDIESDLAQYKIAYNEHEIKIKDGNRRAPFRAVGGVRLTEYPDILLSIADPSAQSWVNPATRKLVCVYRHGETEVLWEHPLELSISDFIPTVYLQKLRPKCCPRKFLRHFFSQNSLPCTLRIQAN